MPAIYTFLFFVFLATAKGLSVPQRRNSLTSQATLRNGVQLSAVLSRPRANQVRTLLDETQQVFSKSPPSAIELFFQAWNNRDLDSLVDQLADDCVYEDATFPRPFLARKPSTGTFEFLPELQRKLTLLWMTLRLQRIRAKVRGLITSIFDSVEPSSKTGAASLAVLAFVSKLFAKGEETTKSEAYTTADVSENNGILVKLAQMLQPLPQRNAAERYFEAWNRRDTNAASAVFADDCQYDDTVFPNPLNGKVELKKHLDLCADSLPSTFSFVIDDVADGGDRLGVRWHVENNGEQMPFTRGCSFYAIDKTSGLVKSGVDIVEPAVFKLGGVKVFATTLKEKLINEPLRLLPLGVWAAYMYIVFLSDGILPGANALQLEQRTWEEVRDLSLNFFLVSPLLNLPFSPVVHPVLEGVFNLLLSWAALFAGFLSDDRREKPNIFPILPAVAGMQFLTSAFLLPYLTLRTSEPDDSISTTNQVVYMEDLDLPTKIAENRFLGPFLGSVGAGAIAWGVFARAVDFGGLDERMASFWQLMSIDRVGSSFLVDLAIFAVFQGWLVDDDLKRRGVADGDLAILRGTAKYVPFFGLAAYMFLRPSLSSRGDVAE
ncbi:hypothetical protein MHU86_7240 [Fragilaria crotonensis]|nr:hypothetical protein MHU86_7240 [Fragilaria crotonensis]